MAVEERPWEPVPGVDDGIPIVAFVDGVRRIDARLLLDEAGGPVPGICGSFGVGAVIWNRPERRSEIDHVVVERRAILAGGKAPELPPLPLGIIYRPSSIADDDPSALIGAFHDAMRRAESHLAEELGRSGYFVIADGPLYEYTDVAKMGFIKSHRRSYLPESHAPIIGALTDGHRTPLFTIGASGFRRYSWYVRLVPRGTAHSWAGIARCEASAALDRATVVAIADRSAAVLPTVASEPHIDPRAPQNLVPIGALERDLRRRLGDPGLVLRALRTALEAA